MIAISNYNLILNFFFFKQIKCQSQFVLCLPANIPHSVIFDFTCARPEIILENQIFCFCDSCDAFVPMPNDLQLKCDKSEQFNCFGNFFIRPLILQKIFRYENDNQKNDKDEH